MRLEDILPEIPDKDDLLQNYLTTQVNSACERSLQTLLTDVESPSERPFLEAEENSNPVYNYQANQRQRSANPKAPTESFSPYPKMLNPFVPACACINAFSLSIRNRRSPYQEHCSQRK